MAFRFFLGISISSRESGKMKLGLSRDDGTVLATSYSSADLELEWIYIYLFQVTYTCFLVRTRSGCMQVRRSRILRAGVWRETAVDLFLQEVCTHGLFYAVK